RGVDKPPAAFDESAPSVSLRERDGELGLKLVVNRLVVANNGVDVLVRLASGAGESMDSGGHPAGHRPVARAGSLVGWRPGALGGGHHAGAQKGSGWVTRPDQRELTVPGPPFFFPRFAATLTAS